MKLWQNVSKEGGLLKLLNLGWDGLRRVRFSQTKIQGIFIVCLYDGSLKVFLCSDLNTYTYSVCCLKCVLVTLIFRLILTSEDHTCDSVIKLIICRINRALKFSLSGLQLDRLSTYLEN